MMFLPRVCGNGRPSNSLNLIKIALLNPGNYKLWTASANFLFSGRVYELKFVISRRRLDPNKTRFTAPSSRPKRRTSLIHDIILLYGFCYAVFHIQRYRVYRICYCMRRHDIYFNFVLRT